LEKVEIYYGLLKYFTDIWEILRLFGTFSVYFSIFGITNLEKIWQPWSPGNCLSVDLTGPGANPTTFEFTATTPAL
jgi:hypothetical protein